MSIAASWAKSLHKNVMAHFLSKDVGIPWEVNRKVDGEKVSIRLLDPILIRSGKTQYRAEFTVKLTCTISDASLYSLSEKSGEVALLLLEPISINDDCLSPDLDKIDIKYFDWSHGYRQSLMEQKYSVDLRG